MAEHPGCGDFTLSFKGNKVTAGHGGAIYQAGCVSSASVRGQCFLSGTQLHGGAVMVQFQDNEAAGAGKHPPPPIVGHLPVVSQPIIAMLSSE